MIHTISEGDVMGHGQIAEGKVRVSVVMPKELREKLEQLAKADNRSVNNYIVTVLMDAVQQCSDR